MDIDFTRSEWIEIGQLALLFVLVVFAGWLILFGIRRGEGGDDDGEPHPTLLFLHREPALLAGFVTAAAGIAIALGFDVSAELVGAVTGLFSIVLAILVRSTVTSPATIEKSNLRYDDASGTLKRKR